MRSAPEYQVTDRKSTRLNSSHLGISYAVFCLKKKITANGKKQLQRVHAPWSLAVAAEAERVALQRKSPPTRRVGLLLSFISVFFLFFLKERAPPNFPPFPQPPLFPS